MAAGDSSLSAYHPRTGYLSIGRLRQSLGRKRQLQAQKSPHWAGKGRSNFECVHYRVGGRLRIGRLRQGMCRVRLQTAACDVGIWLGCGDTAGALWPSLQPIVPICQSVPVCSDVSVLLSRFLRTSVHAETKCFHFGVVCPVFYVSVGAGFARMS